MFYLIAVIICFLTTKSLLEFEDLIHRLINGEKIKLNKFINPIEIEYVVPSDIGVPVVGQVKFIKSLNSIN